MPPINHFKSSLISSLPLPNELILLIAESLGPADLNSFIQSNRHLAALLTPRFHKLALQDKNGMPALLWASYHGYKGLVKLLLTKGVNTNSKHRSSPLEAAAFRGHVAIVKMLLDAESCEFSVQEQGNALLSAAAGLHGRVVVLLVKNGVDINTSRPVSLYTALHNAAISGNNTMVKLLLRHGASVSVRDQTGLTPLHLAAASGNSPVCVWFLQHGADIAALDDYDRTPLHLAACDGNADVVRLLLKKGVPVDTKDRLGHTPLLYAMVVRNKEVIKLLIKGGADVDVKWRDSDA